jgi:hypothetical protein
MAGVAIEVEALNQSADGRKFRKSAETLNLVSSRVAVLEEVVLLFLNRIREGFVLSTRSLNDDRLLLSQSIVLRDQG